VDLSLHMGKNRLLTFARKPAPVQATFAGYPATTGMETIDYRITDAFVDPPGVSEAENSEELVRLTTFWCYPVDEGSPEVNELPAGAHHPITFGSLNNPCKVSRPTIAVWSEVLRAVPGSKLMILVGEHDGRSPYFAEEFGKRGIEPARLVMVQRRDADEYMKLYQRIDVGLDPFPYNGHMTSCDAMWMGVPVVSLRGKTSVARGGVSLLTNLDLTELLADDEAQYIAIATKLARDRERLAGMRRGLRERMRESPVCDAQRMAREMEEAYRWMWERWTTR
jgi:protein O-GlcNAc transferase